MPPPLDFVLTWIVPTWADLLSLCSLVSSDLVGATEIASS